MKGIEKLKVYIVVLLVFLVLFIAPEKFSSLSIEWIYPGHLFYHLSAFTFLYPNSNSVRKFLTVYLLSISELCLLCFVSKVPVHSLCSTVSIEFIAIFLVYSILPSSITKSAILNNEIRIMTYLNEAFWKSSLLINAIQYTLNFYELSQYSLAKSLFIGILFMMQTHLVYFADNYLTVSGFKKGISRNNIVIHMKHGLILSTIGYTLLSISKSSSDLNYSSDFLALKVCSSYLMVWYSLKAIKRSSI
ncbi:unnamed protein product [Blepharisma stoltei]|uniref:Uncharacterized protein n=1 Tax=Blepharisma stoltei TaxID=1481888 RepID=A0AAU9K6D8_9CILI|nr:unnamed protein product [Blepharisma stoltei]